MRFIRKLSDIVHPVSSSQLAEVPDRVVAADGLVAGDSEEDDIEEDQEEDKEDEDDGYSERTSTLTENQYV